MLVDGTERLSPNPVVIARTANLTPAQVVECLRVGQLLPPAPQEAGPDMPGALALLQSNTSNFVLAKAQYSDAGFPQVLYVLVPVEVLRRLGGNVLAFQALGLAPMPAFSTGQATLPPFELRRVHPPSREEQIEALLNLLTFCQDTLQTVEGILAGLVQGWPLAIVNSPRSFTMRLQFVQGLLSLLPVPARTGITFATHITDPAASLAQLKFTSELARPARHLIYDWGRGVFVTQPPNDPYSRYIISQLRLDPSLVVDQTEQLARTTLWRAMQRERLGGVLAWVARRAATDRTVLNGQPADRALVASILREDPTLPSEMRLAYARHVLAFALALNEPDSADVIPMAAITHPDIAAAVGDQLYNAIRQGHSGLVYAMVARWLLRIPEAAALQWHVILHEAAERHLEALVRDGELQPVRDFLAGLTRAHPALQIEQVMPRLIRLAQPAARDDAQLARLLLILGAETLPAAGFQNMLKDAVMTARLPDEFRAALAYLQPRPREPVPPGVLERAGRPFGEDGALIVARLAEWATYLHRPALIEAPCLDAVLTLARVARGSQRNLIEHITRYFTSTEQLMNLSPAHYRVLPELLLQTGQNDRALTVLEHLQTQYLSAERLPDFARLVEDIFQSVMLPANTLVTALEHLEGSRIRSEPRAAILLGALRGSQWSEELDYAAQRLTTMLFNHSTLVRTIGVDGALQLLSYHVRAENGLNALRVGAALTQEALAQGSDSAALIARMWPSITWNAGMTQAALELLRRYVRGIPLAEIPRVLRYLEREIGPEPVHSLRATHLLRRAMGDQTLLEFIDSVVVGAALFVDLASTYHADKVHPPLHRLRRDFDQMTGNLSDAEREQVSANTFSLAFQVYDMGRTRSRATPRQPAEQQLIEGVLAPRSGVDLLRFMGGHFAQHVQLPLSLQQEEMAHLFRTRSAAMFLRETTAVTRLLHNLQAAFRDGNEAVTPEALAAELDSLWNTLSLYNQRRLRDSFAQACQQLANVISLMADHASDRVLAQTGIGRQLDTGQRQPHTALEALRWISGYFGRKHQRL